MEGVGKVDWSAGADTPLVSRVVCLGTFCRGVGLVVASLGAVVGLDGLDGLGVAFVGFVGSVGFIGFFGFFFF